jgi:hypothetical protein
MPIVPSGYPIGLQDGGTNPTVTGAQTLTEITMTKGSTSFNTLQAWTDIQYGFFGSSTTYARYIKDLTGGWLIGYSPAMSYTGMSMQTNGAGGSYGPTARAALLDSGAPGSASGSDSSGTSSPGTPWSSNRSSIMSSNSSTYGLQPFDGSLPLASGQFAESLFQTYSYQGRTKYGQDFTCNTSGSLGSVSDVNHLAFTSPDGNSQWKVMQIIIGQNTNTTGNFPSANGPYSGSNETADNVGNFVYMAFFRTTGYLSSAAAGNIDATDLFSHITLNGSTVALSSGLSLAAVQSPFTAISATSSNRVWASYTTGINQAIGILWPNLSDAQVQTYANYTGNSTIAVKIFGPSASAVLNNGIAEEHGGNDSLNVALSDYVKGAEFVGASNNSSTIKSSELDVKFSDYRDSAEDGGAAGSGASGVAVTTATEPNNYYKRRGFQLALIDYYYAYAVGYTYQPAWGSHSPNPATVAINGKTQQIVGAWYRYDPSGFHISVIVSPTSRATADMMGTNDWSSIELYKANNTSHSDYLTLTSSSSGYSYSVINQYSSGIGSSQLLPQVKLTFSSNSPSGTNNYLYNWVYDNGNGSGVQNQNFTLTLS